MSSLVDQAELKPQDSYAVDEFTPHWSQYWLFVKSVQDQQPVISNVITVFTELHDYHSQWID